MLVEGEYHGSRSVGDSLSVAWAQHHYASISRWVVHPLKFFRRWEDGLACQLYSLQRIVSDGLLSTCSRAVLRLLTRCPQGNDKARCHEDQICLNRRSY